MAECFIPGIRSESSQVSAIEDDDGGANTIPSGWWAPLRTAAGDALDCTAAFPPIATHLVANPYTGQEQTFADRIPEDPTLWRIDNV
jgi:hypothetical protein